MNPATIAAVLSAGAGLVAAVTALIKAIQAGRQAATAHGKITGLTAAMGEIGAAVAQHAAAPHGQAHPYPAPEQAAK